MPVLQAPLFVGGIALLAAFAMFFWPAKAASFLLLFAPVIWAFGATDIHSSDPAATNIVTAVSGVATVMYARFLFVPQKNRSLAWLQRAAIVYCLAILPAAFFSPSFKAGIGGSLRLICPVVFLFAILRCSPPWNIHTPQFRAIALSTICMFGVIVAAQFTGEGTLYLGGFDRLRAFALSPQHVSLYSVLMVGVLISGVLLGRRRYLYMSGIAVLLACAYLTGFRTAWIGLASLISVVMVIAVRSGLAKFLALLIALSLLAASGIIVQSLARYAHADEAMSVDLLDAIMSGRIKTDAIAFDRYLRGTPSEWLFGIGGVHSSSEATLEGGGTGDAVHSDLFATLIECGIIGALGYLCFNLTIGWILLRSMRYLPRQHASRTFVAVGFSCFIAFTLMGISGALYTNVFVGWCYYGFLGIILAQIPDSPLAYQNEGKYCNPAVTAAVKLGRHAYVHYGMRAGVV